MSCFNTDCAKAGKCVAAPNSGCRASIVLPVERHTEPTDDEIRRIWNKVQDPVALVRAILAAANQASALPLPAAWIRTDHLQKAMRAPFLCRVQPTQEP